MVLKDWRLTGCFGSRQKLYGTLGVRFGERRADPGQHRSIPIDKETNCATVWELGVIIVVLHGRVSSCNLNLFYKTHPCLFESMAVVQKVSLGRIAGPIVCLDPTGHSSKSRLTSLTLVSYAGS
jgi:hypothetical protein